MAEFYLLAVEKADAGLFCFVENGEAAFRDMTDAIGNALGLGPVEPMAPEEAIAAWSRAHAVFSLGSNCRVRGRRARTRLGWSPRHGSAVEWIREELVRA